jgi:hypothetical protein
LNVILGKGVDIVLSVEASAGVVAYGTESEENVAMPPAAVSIVKNIAADADFASLNVILNTYLEFERVCRL